MGNDRIYQVLTELERTLVDFIREHRITHDEYRAATRIIADSVRAGEESLLFDVFLEAPATDTDNAGRAGSVVAIEGPFYLPGAPLLEPPYVLPARPDERGDTLVFSGTVTSPGGAPLAGVELDLWHADADGRYSGIHPGVPAGNLRGRFRADEHGSFTVRTIVPPPYEIPASGPTGRVLRELGRHCYRPAHLHVKLRHPGHEELTSQLYFAGDRYLGSDVANAVRDGLVLTLRAEESGYRAHYDFVLAPG